MPPEVAPDGSPQDGKPADPPDGTSDAAQDADADGSSSITDVAVLQRELARAGRNAAKYRAELKAFQDAEAEAKKATETEQERLTRHSAELEKKLAEAEAKAKKATLEAAVSKAAAALGIIDPDAAVKLLDTDELDLDDEGLPKNVDVALKALIKAKPYLAQKPDTETPGSINGSAGTQAGPAPKLTAEELAVAEAAGMTPERYGALKGVKTLADWKKANPAAK